MRVAMMIECDGPGGAETMLFRLSEELRRRDHLVIPVGPRTGTGWLSKAFGDVGITVENYWLKRPVDPSCVTRLAELLKANRIDIVHSHDFTMAVYGAAAARRLRIPHVITMHGGVGVCSVLRRRIALRWAMRHSAHTVMVSGATARQFAADLGMPERAFDVVPNGVPVNLGTDTRVRAEFGIRDDEVVILAVGNLEAHKGHRVLVEALRRLRDEGLPVPWRLIIAGGRGGSQHDALVQQIRDGQLGNQIHIALNRNDVPDLQALADIYAMPSIVEGLPMALLEAMVAGRAVVASRTAGIPEAVVDGRDGLLVPPGDVDALTNALRALLTDKQRRQQLGEAARVRSHKEFTLQVMTDCYEDLYRRSLTAFGRGIGSAA